MQEWYKHDENKIALLAGSGSHSYGELKQAVMLFASGLLESHNDLEEQRVAFLLPANFDYVTALLGIWSAGGIAVPLNVSSAQAELEHALSCAQVSRLIVSGDNIELEKLCVSLGIAMVQHKEIMAGKLCDLPDIEPNRRAMILFTSGTTNKPKGVVTTHKNIRAQIASLVQAWEWQGDDSIPLFLPLHHIHGIINILCCGLWAGARIRLFEKFDIVKILDHVQGHEFSIFMAVPTIYIKLIGYIQALPNNQKERICTAFNKMRLNVSGSAACPVKVYNQWLELTGNTLLERYGMTEIGMAIGNPYLGNRRAGSVGLPLPGVEIGLFDEQNHVINYENVSGEIRVKGGNVFKEYWNNPDATKGCFQNKWFCTGDIAVLESGYYRIMGRSSIDIIKSGGYKLSALEIEGVLLNHNNIAECAVVGINDEVWGEAVTAFIVLHSDAELNLQELKAWCKGTMSAYKVPRKFIVLAMLPRNSMGKVTKSVLKNNY